MIEILIPIFIFAAVAAIFVGISINRNNVMAEIAAKLGFPYTKKILGVGAIEGTYKDHNLIANITYVGSGRHRQQYFTMHLFTSQKLPIFTITQETLFTVLARKMGKTDIQVGNPAFDKRFFIKSREADQLKKLLDADIQHHMLELPNTASIESNGYSIVLKVKGFPNSENALLWIGSLSVILEKMESHFKK